MPLISFNSVFHSLIPSFVRSCVRSLICKKFALPFRSFSFIHSCIHSSSFHFIFMSFSCLFISSPFLSFRSFVHPIKAFLSFHSWHSPSFIMSSIHSAFIQSFIHLVVHSVSQPALHHFSCSVVHALKHTTHTYIINIYVCTSAYIHTYMHAYIHTSIHVHTHMYAHIYNM